MSFNTILVPVDFTINTRVSIQKGIELCEGPDPSIHLFHIPRVIDGGISLFYRHLIGKNVDRVEKDSPELQHNLEECVRYIRKLRSDISACYCISYSTPIEKAIAEKAKDIAADLIVIGKNSQHSLLPFLNTIVPSRLAKRTGISVLTAKPGALLSSTFRTVVVPIGLKYSERKVSIINELANKFYLHVKLLLLVEKGDDTERLQISLVNTCRMLKNRPLDSISYEVLNTGKRNVDILNYCRKVDADLLIVQSEAETKTGWLNKHISDDLPVSSKTQILAIGKDNLSLV